LHMSKLRPGRALSLPRGRWCAPGRRLPSGRHPPLFRGQSLWPRWIIPSAGGTFTRRQREFTRFTHHPGNRLAASPEPGTPAGSRRSSPRPPPPDGTRPASAFTPGFAPRSYPRRTPERRQALAHWPGYYTLDISRTSKRCLPLDSSTLTSHVVRRCLHHHRGHLPAPQPVRQRQHLPFRGAEGTGLSRPPRRIPVRWHPDRRHHLRLADIDAAHPVPVQRLVSHLVHASLLLPGPGRLACEQVPPGDLEGKRRI